MGLLEVEDVRVEFGGIVALDDLGFVVDAGQICALIGPNGAGKTTLFNCVSRVYQPTTGTIRFDGKDLLALPPHKVAAAGIARTFQNVALFPTLTVRENVMTGAQARGHGGALRSAFRIGVAHQERDLVAYANELLERLALSEYAGRQATGLPYGTLKRIEIARALAGQPRMLLLDEPAAGLTHGEVDELAELIRTLRTDFDLTVLLVEHHMGMVMSLCEHIVVLDLGRKLAEGTPQQVGTDQRVVAAYLGTSA